MTDWSSYQQRLFDEAKSRIGKGKHYIGHACAGSGKSTVEIETVKNVVVPSVKNGERVALIAFNKDIAESNKIKLGSLPPNVKSATYHSFGLALIRNTFKYVDVNTAKFDNWFNASYGDDWRYTFYSVKKLVSLCKGAVISYPDNATLESLAIEYDIPLFQKKSGFVAEKIFDMTRLAILNAMENPQEVDFDDMIFLPNALDAIGPMKYAFIGVDELQDTNTAQRRLIAMCTEEGYTLNFGVGDRYQAIYHFRGAGATSIDDFKNEFDADEFPLSISYRCPRAVAKLVNQKFPHIKFEIPEWAIEGSVSQIKIDKVIEELRPHDMVLCRVNADNVTLCLALIRAGKKAVIRGREIGEGLRVLIKQSRCESILDFHYFMENWKEEETKKAIAINSKTRVQIVEERYDVMLALMNGASTMEELIKLSNDIFGDKDNGGIILSSVHRAKGLEAERVFILRPDLMPHPAAESLVDQEQEANIEYVAITRSLRDLIYIR